MHEAISRVSGLAIQAKERRWIGGAYLGGDLGLRVYGPLEVQIAAGAAWFPGSFDFTIDEGGLSRSLLSLHALRLDLKVGLRVEF